MEGRTSHLLDQSQVAGVEITAKSDVIREGEDTVLRYGSVYRVGRDGLHIVSTPFVYISTMKSAIQEGLWLWVALAHLLNFEHAGIFGGVDLGYYYVDLRVGTPPMKQTVIVDTGSSLTAFPCAGCENCGHHLDSYFDYRHSNTSRVVTCSEDVSCNSCQSDRCHYHQGYAEGSSIAGFLVEDYVRLGDDETAEVTKLIFGCHDLETNLFRTQLADGIMGLAFSQDNKRLPTLVDALYKSHEINTDVFALCLGQLDGYMTIGGYNSSLHLSPLQFTRLYDSTYYAVNLKGMVVGGHRVDVRADQFGSMYGGVGTIVDSGTTFVYFREPVYDRMWSAFENYCTYAGKCKGERVSVPGESHSCYRLKDDNSTFFFSTFPTLHLEIDDLTIEWTPERYLFTWPDHPQDYCLGVYSNGGGGNVLGGLFMRGMDIVFDRVNNSIGFAQAECNSSYILSGGRRSITDPHPNVSNPIPSHNTLSLQWIFLALGIAVGIVLMVVGISVYIRRKRYPRLVTDLGDSKPGWTEVKAEVQPIPE